jgi:hypothetical protein
MCHLASVDELRHWLKVPEGKLLRWQELRRDVLEPALRQIKDHPTGAGFRVRMQVVKESRAIIGVVFEVLKTKERQAFDAKLKDHEKHLNLFEVRPKTDTYAKAKAATLGWDIYVLEAEWKAWGSQQQEWPPKNPDGAFIGFCRQRGQYPETRERSGTRMQGTACVGESGT